MVRNITGKKVPSHLLHLKNSDGTLITDKTDVADKLGETFQKNSSSENYSEKFKPTKKREEKKPLNFKTNKNRHIINVFD